MRNPPPFTDPIHVVVELKANAFKPGHAGQDRFIGTQNPFSYLEIGAVSSDGIIADSIIDGDEAPSRAAWHVERGNVLTSTARPIRGLTAIIEDSQHGSVASSGFAVLTPRGISPELLLCYLKLPQICELMDLHTSASIYPAISVSDIRSRGWQSKRFPSRSEIPWIHRFL